MSSRPEPEIGRAFALLFVGCGLWTLLALRLGAPYLPMTDLPQHVAQVDLWQQLDGNAELAGQYALNLATPYLGGYLVARSLASVVSTTSAVVATVAISVLALPLSLLWLQWIRRRDPWWSLLGFPLAFGFSFYWGFLNFLISLPVAILYCGLLVLQLEPTHPEHRQTRLHSASLAAVGILLLACHLLTFLVVVTASLVLTTLCRARTGVATWVSLLCPLPLAAIWILARQREGVFATEPVTWDWGIGRILQIPAALLSADPQALSATAIVLTVLLLLLGVVGFQGWNPVPRLGLTVWVAILLLLPLRAYGAYQIHPRFAVLAIPWLVMSVPLLHGSHRRRLHALLGIVAVAGLIVIGLRLRAFAEEATPFSRLVEAVPSGSSVLTVVVDSTSDAVDGSPYAHFGAWFQVETGAKPLFSFVDLPQMLIVRRNVRLETTPPLAWYDPLTTWEKAPPSDWTAVRRPSVGDLARAEERGALWLRSGDWWLFKN